jgi:hypothetical protein
MAGMAFASMVEMRRRTLDSEMANAIEITLASYRQLPGCVKYRTVVPESDLTQMT